MQVPPISQVQNQTSFGILKGYRKTPYGEFTWGVFKGARIEVYDAKRDSSKLIHVSDNKTLQWLKYKFLYMQNGFKRVSKSSAQLPKDLD